MNGGNIKQVRNMKSKFNQKSKIKVNDSRQ